MSTFYEHALQLKRHLTGAGDDGVTLELSPGSAPKSVSVSGVQISAVGGAIARLFAGDDLIWQRGFQASLSEHWGYGDLAAPPGVSVRLRVDGTDVRANFQASVFRSLAYAPATN